QIYLEGADALETGLYGRAREKFQHVIDHDGDDLKEAKRKLVRATASEGDEALVSKIIAEVEAKRQWGNPPYKNMLDDLGPWRGKPTSKQVEAITLYNTVHDEWEETVIVELDKLADEKERRPLLDRMIELIGVLDSELKSKVAVEYQATLLPWIYEKKAIKAHLEAEKLPLTRPLPAKAPKKMMASKEEKYEEAISFWDKAIDFAIEIEALLAGRQRSHIALAFARTDRNRMTVKNEQARQELEEVALSYPDEIEIHFRLAQVYVDLKSYRPAHVQLDQAEACQINLSAIEMEIWQTKIVDLRRQVIQDKEENDLKTELEELLNKDQDVMEYVGAFSLFQEYVQKLEEQRDSLEDDTSACIQIEMLVNNIEGWFRDVIRKLVQSLAASSSLEDSIPASYQDREERWLTAVKILALFNKHTKARTIFREVLMEDTLLRQDVRALVDHPTAAPKISAANGKRIPEEAALDAHIGQAETLRDRAILVEKVLDHSRWGQAIVVGQEPAEAALLTNQDLCSIQVIRLLSELRSLKLYLCAVEDALDQARSDDQWQKIDWTEMVRVLLVSMEAQGGEKSDWRLQDWTLQGTWQKAATALEESRLSSQKLERAPWTEINELFRRWLVGEKWQEVSKALADLPASFDGHPTVSWVRTMVTNASNVRMQLIVHMAELFTLIQAEQFKKAMDKMEEIINLDVTDGFRFRQRVVFIDPYDGTPLCLADIDEGGFNKKMQAKQGQWDTLVFWLSELARRVNWNDAYQQIEQHLLHARYNEAWKMCNDALEGGAGEGLTNEFGGVYSLRQLNNRLTGGQAELNQAPLSRRAAGALAEAARVRLELLEAIRDAEILLTEESFGSDVSVAQQIPLNQIPIKVQQENWSSWVNKIESGIQELKRMGNSWYHRLVSTGIKNKRIDLLERVREAKEEEKIAPDWEGWKEFEDRINNA
ncbi:MAG: hypothetical protein JXA42_19270, partial [Anaerolineales bacterium]|nr:hypothetical protein [Anaerolineales bacterium]